MRFQNQVWAGVLAIMLGAAVAAGAASPPEIESAAAAAVPAVPEAEPAAAAEPEPAAAKAEPASAPDGPWTYAAVGQVNFTQNRFDNWAPGGENALAWQGSLSGQAKQDRPVYTWTTDLKLAYGQNRTGEGIFFKTSDEIRLESVFAYKWLEVLNPFVSVKAETQFTEGFRGEGDERVPVSDFLDPGYFTESLGLGYHAGETFATRLGLAARQTVTDRFPAPYADDPDTSEVERFKNEVGAEWVTDLKLQLSKILLFTSKLEAFSAFRRLDETRVRWDNILAAEVAPYVNVNFNLQLVYDRNVSVQRQLKQVLAMGLTYTLS